MFRSCGLSLLGGRARDGAPSKGGWFGMLMPFNYRIFNDVRYDSQDLWTEEAECTAKKSKNFI